MGQNTHTGWNSNIIALAPEGFIIVATGRGPAWGMIAKGRPLARFVY